MSRPRSRGSTAPSEYFGSIDPLWVGPNTPPLDARFHDACHSLADWVGPVWADNAASNYMRMRNTLIDASSRWHAHDWDADRRRIEQRKQANHQRKELAARTKAFRTQLSKFPDRLAERDLLTFVLGEAEIEVPESLTYLNGVNALSRALLRLERDLARPDTATAFFGPLEFPKLPVRLPSIETAICLALADTVSFMRRDRHKIGVAEKGRPPNVAPNLPWKAIAEFVVAPSVDGETIAEPENLAARAKALAPKVKTIKRRP